MGHISLSMNSPPPAHHLCTIGISSPATMDCRLHDAIVKGNVPAFLKLVEEDEDLLKQTTRGTSNTVLHLAARFGHAVLAAAILELRPEMVEAGNADMDTPLHEACREGRMEIVSLLPQIDPGVVHKLNGRQESALFVAHERERVEVVKHLLGFPALLTQEQDFLTTSLHVAVSAGHTEKVKEILKARPAVAWKRNWQGCSPLHLACSKGLLEITRELLRLDSDLATLLDLQGLAPLHCAASKGRVSVIHEILSTSLESAEIRTRNGETVLHLAVKNKQFEALRYLVEILSVSTLINSPDNDGNTILHLAIAGNLSAMVIYLLKLGIEVNAQNLKGHTALDLVESDASNSGALAIVQALQEARAKRGVELPPISPEIQPIAEPFAPGRLHENIQNLPSKKASGSQGQQYCSPHRRATQLEHQMEGIRNARNTIIVVTVLIATVTFAAGINPPGGFNQETGKATMGRQTPFKIFMTFNIGALFLSLGIVNILVSVIPFRRKAMMKLLTLTHKIMWLSTLFLSSAYIAAVWAIMPHDKEMGWVSIELVCIGGGCTLTVFLVLGVMLAKHWHRKWESRESKENSTISHVGESPYNSDIDISDQEGYHLY